MSKQFLTYDEQIKKLRKNKNMIIDDESYAKEILEKYSYYNFINSTKLCFTTRHKKDGEHEYEKSFFQDWVDVYEDTFPLKYFLTNEILKIEDQLASLVSYYITHNYQTNKFNGIPSYVKTYVSCFEENKIFKDKEYYQIQHEVINNSWKYVQQLTFGQLFNVFHHLPNEVKHDMLKKLNYPFKSVQTMVSLRNDLVHNVPYLIMVNPSNAAYRKKIKKVIKEIVSCDKEMKHRFKIYNDFISKYNAEG